MLARSVKRERERERERPRLTVSQRGVAPCPTSAMSAIRRKQSDVERQEGMIRTNIKTKSCLHCWTHLISRQTNILHYSVRH